ncbi:MAG: hypothetical protein GY810_01405 [Aureispira sp.]|nr:hypothetical protein [Aureispira sp.]
MKISTLLIGILLSLLCLSLSISAQVKIGDNANSIHPASVLELESTNKGFLPPRVPLTNINNWSPLAGAAIEGMVVYSEGGALANGFYYWDNTQWQRLSAAQDAEWLDANINGNPLILASQAAATGDTVVIRDNGNIGIGTTTPDVKLVVNTPAAGNQSTGDIRLEGTGSSGLWHKIQNSDNSFLFGMDSGERFRFISGDGADTALIIQQDGDIGIGTDLPSERLHIFGGNIAVQNVGLPGEYIAMKPNGFNSQLDIERGSGGNVRVRANEFQGITTVLSNRFADAYDIGSTFVIGNATKTTDAPAGDIRISGQNPLPLATTNQDGGDILITGAAGVGIGVDGDVILASTRGNVGVGTTTPSEKLHVFGGNFALQNAAAGDYINLVPNAFSSALTIQRGTAGNVRVDANTFRAGTMVMADRYTSQFDGGNEIEIGGQNRSADSPTGNISIVATDAFASATGTNQNGGNVSINGGANSGVGTYGDVVLATQGGNVGIGTNTPSQKLQVAGNIAPDVDATHDLGTAALRWNNVFAQNGTIQTSDRRLKKNIVGLDYGLSTVMQMKPVHFEWKKDGQAKIGFIAQDLETLIPEVVTKGDDANNTRGVNYAEIVTVLTKAIQEQQAQIEELKVQNGQLTQKNEELEGHVNEIDQLKAELSEIKSLLQSTSNNNK